MYELFLPCQAASAVEAKRASHKNQEGAMKIAVAINDIGLPVSEV
jgi:hypothetical protein